MCSLCIENGNGITNPQVVVGAAIGVHASEVNLVAIASENTATISDDSSDFIASSLDIHSVHIEIRGGVLLSPFRTIDMDRADQDHMTLVFAFSALQRLARPDEVVTDAHRWTEYIGVAGDAPPDAIVAFVESAGLDPDFVSGEAGKTGNLATIRQQFRTERHVFIGTTDEDRDIAEALGWEHLSIEEAAENADWTLVDAASEDRG
jgi:hypothetical protein